MTRIRIAFVFIICSLLVANVHAQCKFTYDTTIKKRVYSIVDSMPQYVGGHTAMLQFIAENYHYPEGQQEFQASFKIGFIVDKKGRVIGIGVPSKSKEQETSAEKELIRVMSKMPPWKPGKCRRKKVPVQMYLPLYF